MVSISTSLDNFCYMPWYGLAIAANGNIKPCCQYKGGVANTLDSDIIEEYNNDKMKSLRSKFLSKQKPKECNSCWEREKQIGESRRLWFQEKFDEYIDKDETLTVNLQNPQWIQADINFGNLCNLKCRMCGVWASYGWKDDEIALANISKDYKKQKEPVQLIEQNLNTIKSLLPGLKNIKRIDFKGGEPMMAKHHIEFLDYMIEKGYQKNVTLQYTTNGTIVNKKILSKLSKFKNVRIMFSIEGTKNLYQYIRGGKYDIDHFVETVRLYDKLDNVLLGFNVTMQTYNVLDLHNLYIFLNCLNLKHGSAKGAFNTICNEPNYLNPLNIPYELRFDIINKLENINDFTNFNTSLKSFKFDIELWNIFVNFTKDLDKLRNENVLNYIPEFSEYF